VTVSPRIYLVELMCVYGRASLQTPMWIKAGGREGADSLEAATAAILGSDVMKSVPRDDFRDGYSGTLRHVGIAVVPVSSVVL
jgi:hypothetical protein